MDSETISLISDVVVGLSAIIIAIVAIPGLNAWRKELTGKAKFELARNIIRLSLKLEADFKFYRNPFSNSSEAIGRKRKENESQKEAQLLDQWYIRTQRFNLFAEDLQKLQELDWEAEATLKEEDSRAVSKTIGAFKECYVELLSAIESYFQTSYEEINKGSQIKDQEWLSELRREVYSPKEDKLLKKITDNKEQLATVLKAYVK